MPFRSQGFIIAHAETGSAVFATIDTKLYLPVVSLLTKGNTKLLQQLKSGSSELSIEVNTYQK